MGNTKNSIDGIQTKKAKKTEISAIDGIKVKKKTIKTTNPEALISDMVQQQERPLKKETDNLFEQNFSEETTWNEEPIDSPVEGNVQDENIIESFVENTEPSKEEKPKKKTGKVIAKILKYILLSIELGSAAFLVYLIFRANILNITYLSIAISAIVLLFAFTAFKLIRKKTKTPMRVICIVLSIVLSAVYITGAVYLGKTIGFLEKITTQREYATESYSVAVLKTSGIETIEELTNEKIGLIETNKHLDLVDSKLSETITFEKANQQNLGAMVLGLNSGELKAIILSDSQLNLISEEQKELYESLNIIFTFTIEFKIESATNTIDISNEPFILYISGSDDRGELTDTGRSDVNMLAVINPQTGKILLVSTPRDYYVQLHGTTGTKDKLTHAGMYGTEMSRATLADLYGINIDYTAKVGFNTVTKIVDAINGVDINSDKAFVPWTDNSCYIIYGPQHLDGRCALAFARERHAYSTGDRHRGENQQAVLTAIFEKITKPEYLIGYPNILAAIENDLITTFTYDQITEFAKKQLDTLKKWNIESISVDGTGSMQPTYSMGDQLLYVMYPDENSIQTAKEKINAVLNPEAQVVEGASEVENPEPVQE